MIELASIIIPGLFILFFVWMFTEQLSRSIEELGYPMPAWVRVVLISLIMIAFVAASITPEMSVNAFHTN